MPRRTPHVPPCVPHGGSEGNDATRSDRRSVHEQAGHLRQRVPKHSSPQHSRPTASTGCSCTNHQDQPASSPRPVVTGHKVGGPRPFLHDVRPARDVVGRPPTPCRSSAAGARPTASARRLDDRAPSPRAQPVARARAQVAVLGTSRSANTFSSSSSTSRCSDSSAMVDFAAVVVTRQQRVQLRLVASASRSAGTPRPAWRRSAGPPRPASVHSGKETVGWLVELADRAWTPTRAQPLLEAGDPWQTSSASRPLRGTRCVRCAAHRRGAAGPG